MIEAIISGVIGLIGAIVGGVATYLSVNKQLKFEREKISNEEKERLNIALTIIKIFLIKEIKGNYNILKGTEINKILKREINSTEFYSIGNFTFCYNDFDRIKYDIIKYNVQEIHDTINIYQMFNFIEENRSKKYIELTEDEKEFVKNGMIKCEEMIEGQVEKNM